MKPILIVDDDSAIRSALQKVLSAEGFQTVEAADPAEALLQFQAADIALVLLDLNLPTKCGWDLFECLTDMDPTVPIIIMTGRPDQWGLAANAGAGALIEKPIEVDHLLKSIRELLAEPNDTRLRRLLGCHNSRRHAVPALHTRSTRLLMPR